MNAIIFGISGQDGHYLDELLNNKGIEVIGVSRSKGNWLVGDVADRETVEKLIKNYRPEFIFHFAANSTIKHDALFENHETIATGTLNILEAVYRHSPQSKVFISGSGLQFLNNSNPITETDPFDASSPYAVSRIQSVYAARYYRRLGLKIYVGYFFHHDSPFRSERHLSMRIARAAMRIKGGSAEIIEIGNVDVVKEYNYAGDIVEAIWVLMNQDAVFEAVVGSGKGYTIRDWLCICFERIGKPWQQYVKISNGYQSDFISMISNPKTLFSLGWKPSTTIYELAEKMIGE